MMIDKLKLAVMLTLALALPGLGAGAVYRHARGQQAAADPLSSTEPSPTSRKTAADRKELRVDQLGDPLLPGAVRRLGTVRFRRVGPVNSVAFAPDGKTLASASDDRTVLRQFKGHQKGGVYSLAHAPDGKTLASAGYDKTVRLWNVATGQELRQLQGHQDAVTCVAYAPDGKTLVSASEDQTVRLWDAVTGKELRQFQGHQGEVFSLAYAPDGKTLASAGADKIVRLWDVATGKELRQLQGHQDVVTCVAYAPDGKTLVSSSDDKATLRDAATGKELYQFQGHPGAMRSIAFAPGDRTLASVGYDNTVRLWDAASGKELRQFQVGPSASPLKKTAGGAVFGALAPDGKTLAVTGRDGTVKLWEVGTGKERLVLSLEQADIAFSATWSPCGQMLVTSHRNSTVLLCGRFGQTLPPVGRLSAEQLDERWADLANDDAARAYRAMGQLVHVAEQAVPLLRRQLKPTVAGDAQRIAVLIGQLDSNEFTVRQQATKELEKLGEQARGALRRAQAAKPALEPSQRIEALLAKLDGPTAEALRTWRAMEVLEHIGTPEARKVLEELAGGATDHRITEEAKAALQRTVKRSTTP